MANGNADVYLVPEGYSNSGIGIYAYPDGLSIGGWYDSMVGIEGGFLTWDEIDALRTKAKRRKPYRSAT